MSLKRNLALGGALAALTITLRILCGEPDVPGTDPLTRGVVPEARRSSAASPTLDSPSAADAERRQSAAPESASAAEGDEASPEAAAPIGARGHVRRVGGALPENVDVILSAAGGGELCRTTAARDGSFELRCDQPLESGWSVRTDLARIAQRGAHAALAPDGRGGLAAHLPGEAPVEIELALGLAPAISGRVFDRATGAAIDSAEIRVEPAPWFESREESVAQSQADGSYELELKDMPLRNLLVWCRAGGWQSRRFGPQDIEFARTPGESLRIDFALERPVPWRGRVSGALDGRPVAGATIRVGSDCDVFATFGDSETSDAEGLFELDLPQIPVDAAWVHVSAPGFAPVALRGAKPGEELHIVLGPSVTLSGSVRTPAGEPIEGASVRIAFDGDASWDEGSVLDSASSDAQGAFEFALQFAPIDAARIRVEADGCLPFEAKLADVIGSAGRGRPVARIELRAAH